jgi:catechol 2,3-dioxygenase-like lactoylglutathione lyase family enzyme
VDELLSNLQRKEVATMTGKQGLTLPPLAQVGVVVKDLKKSIEHFSRVFGIGPFTSIVFSPEKHWVRGEPFPIKLNIAFAQAGPVQIELIEPVGDGPHKWFLDSKGGGLHHLGFIVDNYDALMDYLKQMKIEILMNAETDVPGMGHVRAAYADSEKADGVLVELIEIT